jgi:hypothetical protein
VSTPTEPGDGVTLPPSPVLEIKPWPNLTQSEKDRGFFRPLRYRHVHKFCKKETLLSEMMAITYALDPKFNRATYCCHCLSYFPVSNFYWGEDNSDVGT